MEEILVCPISKEIFFDPVVASDGHTYERSMILRWLSKNNTSPLTRKPINGILVENHIVKQLVDLYVQSDVSLKENIFIPDCEDYVYHIIEEIAKKNFDALFKFKITSKLLTKNIGNIILMEHLYEYCTESGLFIKLIDMMDDLEFADDTGSRLIHYACVFPMLEVVKYLVEKGVDVECEDKEGYRPIHYACQSSFYSLLEVVKYLAEKGVDLECKNFHGIRPIHDACSFAPLEIVKYLVEKGVDIECRDNDETCPIHLACEKSSVEVVKYLIQVGANTESVDRNGNNILHFACYNRSPDVIKYLVQSGANLDCVDNDGMYPIDHARQSEQSDIIEYLEGLLND